MFFVRISAKPFQVEVPPAITYEACFVFVIFRFSIREEHMKQLPRRVLTVVEIVASARLPRILANANKDCGCCEQNSIVGSGSTSFSHSLIGSNMDAKNFWDCESPTNRQEKHL